MNRHLVWRGLLILTVIGGTVALVIARPARLGLDLKGGTQILLQAESRGRHRADDDALARTVEVLRRRVDQLGVAEPNLQRSGQSRIIVELPGVSDPEQALEIIGRTAQLEFRPVLDASVDPSATPAVPEGGLVVADEQGAQLVLGPAPLTGDAVDQATAVIDSSTGAWEVSMDFRRAGADQWAGMTGQAACASPTDPTRRVAIVLDGQVISSPSVGQEVVCNEGIQGGRTVITGNFDEDEAKDLALLIRAGALPVPVNVVEQRTVGPTLGQAAIKASVKAAITGAALTVLYMILYYRLLGAVAAVALALYGLISYGVLLALNATLTLPGIAGFVLAIGMAVDANVLVFERIKEEYAAREKLGLAVTQGFKKAWSAIADSNATTLLAAVLLFFLGSGAVKGFGVTLTVGVLVSMLSALVVSRFLIEVLAGIGSIRNRPALLGVSARLRLRARLEERPVDLIGHRRVLFSVSALLLAFGLAGLGLRGLNFGIEFTGGRLLEYTTPQQVDLNRLRAELAERGLARAVVQESGTGNVSVRTGQLSGQEARAVETAVEGLGGGAENVRDELVGPSIGNELRRKALIALFVALLVQLAYLAFRFRWTYGLAAVMAMFQDTLVLVGVFAWFGKQIDGVFLAALLTVIGYSINDSVVVFDRIREQRSMRPKESLERVANDACLQTIPRTINTGLGAVFILIALWLLGGQSLQDFALALLIGIVAGTYSSVFTAAPLSVMLDRLRPALSTPARRPPSRPPQPRRRSGTRTPAVKGERR
jgi:SecD/SecF fusion protein